MVNWSGIEDIDAVPTQIWLCREKETDEWLPLRHVDCQALNKTPDKPVVIDNGRATADPTWGKIRFNYTQREMILASATWFMKTDDENDKTKHVLIPMEERDALVVEQLYQNAVYAASSYGKGIKSTDHHLPFVDGKYRVELQKQNGQYMMRKVPIGWFAKSYDLQRGYGAYTLEGEDDEEQLGPVNHIVFVVHGVGEALFAKDDVKFALSMKDEMTKFRLQIQKRQIEKWKKACEAARKKGQEKPPPPNRVEIIPIIWYDRIHSSSNELMQSLQATTLTTIPALREIANDVVFDILMYMTPNFCFDVLECVTDQIITTYDMFKKHNPDFLNSGGKCSMIGHSLGSVICWDLLSILKEEQNVKKDEHGVHITKDGYLSDVGYQQYASAEVQNRVSYGSWGPSLPKSLDRHLPFEPDFALFLGSPLGQFLTLRGAHPVFDELRNESGDKTEISPFTLPCSSVHNVFSPSDVVAYRIEPLLLPRGTTDIPPPVYLTAQGQGVRFHVKAKQLGDDFRKSMEGTKKSVNMFMSGLKDQASSLLQQLDDRHSTAKRAKQEDFESESSELAFPLAGKQRRLDFQLQPNLIDNEYISAVTAHSSYWGNTDVVDYFIDLTTITDDSSSDETNAVLVESKSK